MRHAKSAWDTDAATDHARPLNGRGRRDAPRVAERLVELGWVPDRILSSDAQRTRQTCAGMAEALEGVPVSYASDLYHGGLETIAALVPELDGDNTTVMVVGHNPGWEEAASTLTGVHVMMTTANAALLSTDVEGWAEALRLDGGWRLEHLVRPKDL